MPSTWRPLHHAIYVASSTSCHLLDVLYIMPSTWRPLHHAIYVTSSISCHLRDIHFIMPSMWRPLHHAIYVASSTSCHLLDVLYIMQSTWRPLHHAIYLTSSTSCHLRGVLYIMPSTWRPLHHAIYVASSKSCHLRGVLYIMPILLCSYPSTPLRLIIQHSLLYCSTHVSIFWSINRDGCLGQKRLLSIKMLLIWRINGKTNGNSTEWQMMDLKFKAQNTVVIIVFLLYERCKGMNQTLQKISLSHAYFEII